ncbi:MAG: Autophagy protein 7 [Claussenomyces sp. TS43310]|nr:MAG: Autophagy protein 7 [Claussenomyces sp. TS43310]
MAAPLQYAPFESQIELPFYSALSSLKIDHDRLDDSARPVLGLYEPAISSAQDRSCRMQVLGNALTSDTVTAGCVRADGKIKNVNTIEDFKNMDKTAMLQTTGKQVSAAEEIKYPIWDAINDGTIYSVPSLLSSFTILSFADLKKYKFHYWFGFPALHSDPIWERRAEISRFTGHETTALVDRVGTWRYSVDNREHGFFLAKKVPRHPEDDAVNNAGESDGKGADRRHTLDDEVQDELDYEWQIGSLGGFERGFFKDVPKDNQYIAFVDPSTYPENPGWMLRNLLVLIRRRYKLDSANILCYRDIQARRHEARSFVLHVQSKTPSEPNGQVQEPRIEKMPKVTGWERDGKGNLRSRMTNLAQYMDPQQLADQSVDLNLKLMKWRISPGLNLDKIKETKCLLLGAGTLGSYVSRNLMGWGVRKITFVDYGNVSFSNPVRQPLFDFKDCLEGGAQKAYRAAEALQEIYPGCDSVGHVFSVPMLGHPIVDEKKTRDDFELLEALIKTHDAIFLLMDTRESRWLPTLIGKAEGKVVMNAALGFDTYVVMRHGVAPTDGGEAVLGCYFCNDVVAPADSIKDQTLDQQCTVTRPGVAAIASAYLVELLASILQHPDGGRAPAPKVDGNTSQSSVSYARDPLDHPLGIVPHQIRGFLSGFQNMIISGQSYDCCSACSAKVVNAYRDGGWDFVRKALTEKDYVAELSGLADVQRAAEAAADDLNWSSDEAAVADEEGDGEMI